jgi:Zn-dependent protease/CBS domain-containing protein
MGQGIRLGRLFGVSIYVDLSWAFLFLLVAWNLNALLRSAHADWGAGLSRLVAAAGAVLLLAAIATHELGHALIGRWLGLQGGSLRLFLFGDASWGERTPASATAEILTAGAGPVLSAGVGFASLSALLAGVAPAQGYGPAFASLGPLQTLLAWWAFANLGVGLMHLLPAFPLDGGKLVRAVVWRLTGDVERATRVAAALAQVVAFALVGGGIAVALGFRAPGVGTGLVAGLWLAFLGWFVHVAAGRAMRRSVLGRLLDGVFVSTVMRPRFVQTPPETSIEEVVDRWLLRGEERAIAVVEGDLFVGLVTMADALKAEPREWARTPVSAVMTPLFKLETVTPGEPLEGALERMVAREVSQLPVFERGVLSGLLCRSDLARFLGVLPAGARRLAAPWGGSQERQAA